MAERAGIRTSNLYKVSSELGIRWIYCACGWTVAVLPGV